MSNPEAKKYADEAAAERTARKKLEAELKKFQDAQAAAELAKLGDLEKAQKQLADVQAAHAALQAQYQRAQLTLEATRVAQTLGITDPALALAMLQAEHGHELAFEDDGRPKGLDTLLAKVLAEHPILGGTAAAAGRPAANSGGATNPGAAARTGTITRASYAAMSQQERIARNKEVVEQLRRNGGTLPE